MAVEDSPDWPPPGWTEDVKVSKGRKIKYYTNGETGKKFYSKKEVARYLKTKDTCDDVTQAMNIQGKSFSENNVSDMDNQDGSFAKDNGSQMDNQDNCCSENNVSQTVGKPNNSHEWLPPGWIVELKTRKSGSHAGLSYKVYIDPSTGSKFYSKPEVSKYLKTMKQNNIAGEGQTHGDGEISTTNQKKSEDPKIIRGGGQTRKSKRLKSDTDQASPGIEEGSFSKLKASQDFEEVGEQSCTTKRKKSGITRTTKTYPSHGAGEVFILNEKTSLGSKENGAQSPQSKRQKPGSGCPSAKSVSSVAVDCDSADELPPGWKKESRKNDRGTRNYLLYTDPVHGYKFHSKKEVLRYLQTGDATSCARRPTKRNVASTTKDDSPTTDDASLKRVGGSMTGRQLFSTDELKGGESFGTCSPAQQVESSKKQPDCSVSDPNAIITSILAEINENHSFENVVGDAEIETVSVGVKQPSAVSTESDLLSEKQLLENEQEKHSSKATQQSKKSRKTESLNLGRRVSKRLAGQNAEAAADLDLGERALPAVADKSASLSVNACSQELLQDSDPTPETGNSDQASLNGDPSLDDLPPGWKKEIKITKKANGIRKDPLYIDPVDGYVFRSKKDVFRYLQTGDISSCAIRPVKRDLDAAMTDSSPTTVDTNSKKLVCSVTERQPFAAKESRGRKRSVTCSPKVQAESSKKQPESSASNANTIITSSEADIIVKQNAEISLDTEPEIRDSSADTKVIDAESNAIKRLSAVSTPQSDLPSEQQLPENEPEKHISKEKPEQSRRSRAKKPLTPGRRISKRLVGHSPEPVADLDLGERAFRAVVKKSASLGIPLNVSGQEFSQNKDPTVGTGNSDQAPLSREASGLEFPPDLGKEMLTQNEDLTEGTGNSDQYKDPTVGSGNSDQASLRASGDELSPGLKKEILTHYKDPTVGSGNSDQAYLSRKASLDEIPPGWEKEMLGQNKYSTVGTGNSDQASLSRKLSPDEIPPGWENQIPPGWKYEIPAQNKDPIIGTSNSDQASLSREKASLDEIPPGWEKEILAYNKDPAIRTGNSDQASLIRELASADEFPPGWEKEMLTRNKHPTVGTGNSNSLDDIPPGWEKELLVQQKDHTVGTGNSYQSFLSKEASVDGLPPGWKTEFRIRKNASVIKKDPYYTDPVHGYVFRSKKDVMRYLQTGDIRSCAVKPTKRDPGSTMKDNSPSTHDTSSKKLRCSLTGIQLSATDESKGSKCSVTCSMALQAENSSEHPKSSMFNLNTSISSIVADITEKHSYENLNEDTEIRLDVEPKIRDSVGNTKAAAAETVDVRRSLVVSPQLDFLPEQQLRENEKEKHSNKGVPARLRKIRNSKSSTPVRRVSKRLSRHNPEMVTDLNLGERALHSVVNSSASSGLPMNVSGGQSAQQTDLATGDSDQPSLSRKASSRDDPLEVVKCLSEGQAFKENIDERIWRDSQPAGISYERGKVHLEQHALNERPTAKPAKEEEDGQNRLLNNSQLAESASGRRVFPAEDRSVSERSTVEEVSEKRNGEYKQWQYPQLAEPSWRSVDLNVENQQWQDVQLAPSQRFVDLNMENQEWQDLRLPPSQRSVDLNVGNQQWQASQLAEPSHRNLDLNVDSQPVKEKQTGELVTENQDEQNRRLHAQLASYPFGDYWSDPCMEFAFKTLTGALPVEDTLTFQGSTHQEYNTSYTQADDGCFELPLFNTSSFYLNDAPNHCAPSVEHVVKEQPPINQTFLPTGHNSIPGHSSVVSQNPGLTFLPNGNNSIPGCSSVVSQNPGLNTQAKDYQSKFKSHR
uniref:MBD domain-containing protein n=1 Tax=Solanum lycopersicum TaxID=4081 RepID=A0A3Q7HTI3_SOLLC